jgi:hypothetical protein
MTDLSQVEMNLAPQADTSWFETVRNSMGLRLAGAALSLGGLVGAVGAEGSAHAATEHSSAEATATASMTPTKVMDQVRNVYARMYDADNLSSKKVLAMKRASLSSSKLSLTGKCYGSHDSRYKELVDNGVDTKSRNCVDRGTSTYKHTKDTYTSPLKTIGNKVLASVKLPTTSQEGAAEHVVATASKAEVLYSPATAVISGDKELKEIVLRVGKKPTESYYPQTS